MSPRGFGCNQGKSAQLAEGPEVIAFPQKFSGEENVNIGAFSILYMSFRTFSLHFDPESVFLIAWRANQEDIR
jgi:hypothetical protein